MGRNFAQDLSVSVPLEVGVKVHLTGNFYPPIPSSMVIPCIEALYAVAEGDSYRQIELPSPVTFKGEATAPANAIVEQHHLEEFLNTILEVEDVIE
jgi:hypothetical protein